MANMSYASLTALLYLYLFTYCINRKNVNSFASLVEATNNINRIKPVNLNGYVRFATASPFRTRWKIE